MKYGKILAILLGAAAFTFSAPLSLVSAQAAIIVDDSDGGSEDSDSSDDTDSEESAEDTSTPADDGSEPSVQEPVEDSAQVVIDVDQAPVINTEDIVDMEATDVDVVFTTGKSHSNDDNNEDEEPVRSSQPAESVQPVYVAPEAPAVNQEIVQAPTPEAPAPVVEKEVEAPEVAVEAGAEETDAQQPEVIQEEKAEEPEEALEEEPEQEPVDSAEPEKKVISDNEIPLAQFAYEDQATMPYGLLVALFGICVAAGYVVYRKLLSTRK